QRPSGEIIPARAYPRDGLDGPPRCVAPRDSPDDADQSEDNEHDDSQDEVGDTQAVPGSADRQHTESDHEAEGNAPHPGKPSNRLGPPCVGHGHRKKTRSNPKETISMEFQDLLRRRRMVREFKPDSIPRELLLQVLEVARHAPSAGFSQGFDFVVLDRPDEVSRFIALTQDPQFPYEHLGTPDAPPCLVIA